MPENYSAFYSSISLPSEFFLHFPNNLFERKLQIVVSLIVKSDVFYPAIFGLILAILLGYRLFEANKSPKTENVKTN